MVGHAPRRRSQSWLAFELLHGPAATVSGFTRVPGAVWAAEARFERQATAPTSEVGGEQTRFVLRATPQTGPAG
jgi:hypothetical protein